MLLQISHHVPMSSGFESIASLLMVLDRFTSVQFSGDSSGSDQGSSSQLLKLSRACVGL